MKVYGQDRVNTYTASTQDSPAVAALKGAAGGYVVTWASFDQDGGDDTAGIFAQRYSASGIAVGPEFRVNTSQAGPQVDPAVAGLSNGDFVVTWTDQNGADGSSWGVYAQRFNASGVAQGPEFLVNTFTGNDQGQPSIAAYTGGFVVTWYSNGPDGSGYGVYLQRYNNAGVAQGVETRINTEGSGSQYEPDVAARADGSFVVVWRSDNQDGSGAGVYAQRYNAAGAAAGGEFRVNTSTSSNQYTPRVAVLADGSFVVVWRDDAGLDGSGEAVFAQRYNASGVVQGGEFRVNESVVGSQYMPDVEALSTGGFVVTWFNDSTALDGLSAADVFVREYSNLGVALGGEQRVNVPQGNTQYTPAIADLGAGNYAVVWADNSGADGSGLGVFQQLFGDAAELPRQANPTLGDFGGTLNFAENTVNAAAQVLDSAVSLSDIDSANFDGGRVTAFFTTGGVAEDQLSVVHEGNLAGQIGVAGAVVSYGGTAIGIASGGVNGGNLVITLNANATVGAVEELIQHLGYRNTSGNPNPTRSVSVRVEDGDGGSAVGGIITINVTPELDGTPTAYGEDRVNTHVAGIQNDPETGRLSDGGYVTVWNSDSQDGSSYGIYAQRYSASGVAVGPEFRVNTLTGGEQSYGHVAGLSDGGFIITWQDNNGHDGSSWGVYGQRYDAAGVAQGGQLLLNTTTSNVQFYDVVTAYAGNGGSVVPGFAVLWTAESNAGGSGQDIILQRFTNAGAKLGGELIVNTTVDGTQQLPDVASYANGNLVIVWQDLNGNDGSGYGVFARRYDAAAGTFGAQFQVNTLTAGNQYEAQVGTLSNGGFVVVWGDSNGPDGSGWATFARVYNAAGTALGGAFQVNESTSGNQYQPTVTGLSTGGFVVSFYNDSNGADGTYGDVYIREYDNLGVAVDGERRVNSYTAGSYQYEPAITDLGSGNFVVTWRSDTQDSGTPGVYQQLYGSTAELARQANPDLGDFTGTVTFAENLVNAGAQVIDAAVSLSDADSANFNGGRLDLYYTAGAAAQDQLSVVTQPAGPGQITVAGNVVSYGGAAIGTISGGANGANLRIDFTSNAATPDAVEALVQRLGYANTSSNPNATRDLGLRVSDGDGGSSEPNRITINVTSQTDGTPAAYGEDQVNTHIPGGQFDPETGRLSDGGYVTVWTSDSQDGSSHGIYAQRYNASGVAVGPEFRVSTLTVGEQSYAHVAGLSDGGFIVTWQDSNGHDGSSWGIYGQRYDAASVAQGGQILLNTTTGSGQYHDAVTAYVGNGGSVVPGFAAVWTSESNAGGSGQDIVLQRFTNAGAKIGGELLVNTTIDGTQQLPDIASYANGNLVIVWQDPNGNDGSGYGVFARRYDAAAGTFGAQFQVNTLTAGNQYEAQVSTLSNGGFVVVWGDSNGPDGSGWATFARVYNAAGTALGDGFQVNDFTSGSQYQPTVTGLSTGGFVVSFYNDSYDPAFFSYGDVYIREYDNLGVAVDGERRVNSYTAGSYQYEPAITDLGSGNFVVTWRADSQDSGTTGVYQQLYGSTAELVRQANPDLGDFTGTVTFAENLVNAGAQVIDAAVSLSDADSANFNGGRLDLYYTAGAAAQDQLSVVTQTAGPGQITVAGNVVSYGGAAIGTITGGANGANLRIDFTSNAATPDAVEALVQRLGYANTSSNPNATRDLGLRVSDGDGGSSEPNRITINVTPEIDGATAVYGESVVNTFRPDQQQVPEIAVLTDGSYVIVWQSAGQDGSGDGVYAQRFSATGVATGPEFRVSTTTVDSQNHPHGAGLSNGGFVVVWEDHASHGTGWGVYGQRYDAAGVAQGGPFVFSTAASGDSNAEQVSVAAYAGNGGTVAAGFAAVSTSNAAAGGSGLDIVVQRFTNAGALVGAELLVNTSTTGTQQVPDIAALANGNLVIVWEDNNGTDGSASGIFARRFDAAAGSFGAEFQVNTLTSGDQHNTQVATLSNGGFVVVWRDSSSVDGSGSAVFARVYGAGGAALGDAFQVNEVTTGSQYMAAVTGLSTGGFVVTWHNDYFDAAFSTTSDVYIRQYDNAGVALDGERKLTSPSNSTEYLPAIADLGGGNFVVAYADFNTSGSGGNDTYEIVQQLFGTPAGLARPSANPLLDDVTTVRTIAQADAITPVVIDSDVAVSDTDSANFAGGRLLVFFTSGADANDRLSVASVAAPGAGQFNVTGGNVFYQGTAAGNQIGTISGGTAGAPLAIVFNANVTPAIARALVENITYQYNAASAPIGSRTIAFRLSDGDGGTSEPSSVTIDIVASSPPPSLALSDLEPSITVLESAAQTGVVIDDAATLTSGASGFTGGTLVVSYTENGRAEDQLSIRNEGNGAGQVGFSGGTVSYQNVAIGTAVGGANGTTLTVTFNGAATAQGIERVIENLRYQTTSDGPLESRTIQVQVTDAASASTSQSVVINVTPQADGASPYLGDVQVSTYEPNNQLDPRVATLEGVNAGSYVVVWHSEGQDGSSRGVYGQRYNGFGAPVGTEFQVNTYVPNQQDDPEVAALGDGGFVVVWRSEGQDGSSGGIYAQRYDAGGAPAGSEFRVNGTTTTSDQTHPTVIGLAGGGFVVAWADAQQDSSSYGVFGQRFAANGTTVGSQFAINTFVSNQQYLPTLAALRDDPATGGANEIGFVAVWESNGQDGSAFGIYGKRFDAAGAAVGLEFAINTNTSGDQINPDVAVLAGGNFVVVWHDSADASIRGQRYTAGGAAVGGEFTVSTVDVNSDYSGIPHVAALANGGFVVTWDGVASPSDPGYGVYVQQYNSAGVRVDGVLALSATTQDNQHASDVAGLLAGGNFVGVWESYNQEVPANGSHGIFSRIFAAPGSIVPQTSPQLLDLESAVTFTENVVNAGGQVIDPGLRVVDPDSANFSGGRLVVSVVQGYGSDQAFDPAAPAQDNFSIRDQGPAAGQVGFDGTTVRYGGIAIGTIVSNGQNGADLIVQFNASSTPASVEAVIENVTYRNPSSNPQATRQVAIVVSDGDGGQSPQQNTITINVTPQLDGAVTLIAADAQVNTYAPATQEQPVIAALQGANDGQYVIAWQSLGQDSDNWGVFAQRYDANGSALGPEFQINTTTPGAQWGSQAVGIGGLSTGGFVVTWQSPDGSGHGIYAQRFDAAGIAAGTEFRVSPDITHDQAQPRVLGLAGGAFVIAWADNINADANSYGLRVQHYNASGVEVGTAVLINQTPPGVVPPDAFTADNQSYPELALLNDGGYVVTWHSHAQDGSSWGVYARLMNANGTPRGDAFQVHTTTDGAQVVADVATLTGGDFVVTWKSDVFNGFANQSVIAQRYTSAGVKVGGEVLVNDAGTVPTGDVNPRIAALDTGGYVIAWHASGASSYESYAQQFGATGAKVDSPLRLNTYLSNAQSLPDVAGLNSGRFVAAWQSYFQDGAEYGIYQNLYGPAGSFMRSSAPEISDVVTSVTVAENIANGAGVLIDTAVSVLDADSANFDGGRLIVSVISGYGSAGSDLSQNQPSQDQLGIRNQGTGAGQVDVSGASVRFGGVTVGTIVSNGANGADLVVQWNASATPNVVEAVIENIVYRNTSNDAVASRTVSLTTSDGDGATSVPRVLQINVTPEVDGVAALFAPERVNTYAVNVQERPDLARLADGGYVIVWESEGQDGWADGVFGQRYDAIGAPVGNEFRVSDYTPFSQYEATVTGLTGGGFVVAFRSDNRDGSGSAVFAQRFDASGARAGGELQVNTSTSGNQYQPNITALNDGGFAVAWYSDGERNGEYYDVFFQRYSATGVAQGGEVRANTAIPANPFSQQYEPHILQLSGGDIVVAWRSDGQDGSLSGVHAQRFNSAGVAQGVEFQINTTTENYQYDVQLARAGAGFVAVWISREQDGSGDGIYGRRYDASGAPLSGEFRVNETAPNAQVEPSVASLSNGGFVVTWLGYNATTGNYDVLAQQYDTAGTRVDGETRLDNTTSNSSPNVIGLVNGSFVTAWQGQTDGDGSGIFQRIAGNPADFPRQSAPLLVDFTTSVTFFENDLNSAPQLIDPGVGLADPDSANFAGGRLDLSIITPYGNPNQFNIAGINAQDQLGIRNQGAGAGQIGVSGNAVSYQGTTFGTIVGTGVNGAPLIVTFNANATAQAVESLIENLTYQNLLSNPEPSRTISLRVSDGDGGTTLPHAVTINITPQPDGAVPFGGELTANTTITGSQAAPALARLSDGGYVVVWEDQSGADTSSYGVYGQRYDSSDNKVGGEFRANTTVSSAQYEPDVVGLSGGGFAVVWRSDAGDGSGTGVYMQRFNTGPGITTPTLAGIETRVNTSISGNQYQPAVSQSSTGGYIVAWYSDGERNGEFYDVFFQRYSATGTAIGAETRANTPISGNVGIQQHEPAIALLTGGDFVLAWRSESQDGDGAGIYSQRFNADGTLDGIETRINSYTTSAQTSASIAGLDDGGYVIVWRSEGQDTSSGGVYAQRYSAAGAAVGGEIRVNYEVSGNQYEPNVTSLDNGGFVVSWTDGDNLWIQQFDAAGNNVDSQVAVNPNPAFFDAKYSPDLISMPDGGFIVGYQGYRPTANGGNDTYDIRLQRYSNTAPNVQNVTVTGLEDTAIVLTYALFSSGFDDPEDQALAEIRIITLPASGLLKLNGVNVVVSQVISAADLQAGELTYQGNANYNGGDQFRWTGSDGNTFAAGSVFTNITITNVNDAPGLNAGVDATALEGTAFSHSITLGDPDTTDTHLVTVSYSGPGSHTGSFQFSTSSDNPNFNVTLPDDGTYTVTVTANDQQGQPNSIESDTFSVVVSNVAPTVPLSGAATVGQGQTYTLTLGAVVDPGDDTETSYTINWGDGPAAQVVSAAALPPSRQVTHSYGTGGDYTISVSVTDEDGTFAAAGTRAVSVTAGLAVDAGADTTVNEGTTVSRTITFTDPVDEAPAGRQVTVDWGDATAAQSFSIGAGVLSFGISHAFADNRATPFTVSVTVDDSGAQQGTDSFLVTVNDVAPTLTVAGVASVNEGSSYTITLGPVTDPGMDTVSQYVINWGDGSSQTVLAANVPANRQFSHVYADGNAGGTSRTIGVDLVNEDGTFVNAGQRSVTVNNVAPTAAVTGADAVNEGSAYALTVGAITEPGTDTRSTYSINWGDGVTEGFTAAQWATAAGSFSHTYADGGAGGSPRTVTVSATDEDGTFTLGTKNLTVNNAAPGLTLGGAATVNEGGTFSLNVVGTDSGGANDPLSYDINWGDGSAVQTLTAAQLAAVSGNVAHVYADDENGTVNATARTIGVTVTDGDGGSTTQTRNVTVNNVAPLATVSGANTVNEGTAYALTVGAITDPGTDTRTGYTIDWGDGVTQGFTVAQWTTAAGNFSHTYADGAAGGSARTVTVSATDEDGTFALGTKALTVNNVAPVLTLGGAATTNEGATFTLNVAASDPAGASDPLGYGIDWGDGSAVQSLTAAQLAALGGNVTHVYADDSDAPGNNATTRTISVAVNDGDGGSATQTRNVTVNNVAPLATVSGANTVNEGSAYALTVGAITEPGTDTRSTYSINWGDGVSDTFTVAQWNTAAGSFSHTYAEGVSGGSARTVTVSTTDEDGTFTLGTKALTVNNAAPGLTLGGAASTNEGSSFSLNVAGTDPAGANDPLSYAITWGDGSAVQNLTAAQLAALGGNVAHVYADDENGPVNATARTISVTVSDGDGGSTTQTRNVTVNNVAPTAPVSGTSSVNEGDPYTLTVGAITEPGTDTRTGYSINWGDGVIESFTVPQWTAAGGTFTHTYGPSGAPRTITVSASDEDGTFVMGSTTVSVGSTTLLWSTLVHNTTVSFDPVTQILLFDEPAISAADVLVAPGSVIFSTGGKTVTFLFDVKQITTGNVVFANGSVLRVGDNAVVTTGDDNPNTFGGGALNDHLKGLGGNDGLTGNAGDDLIYGGTGNDALNGGAGADRMFGEAGDDTYYVDNPGDVATEAINQGLDVVYSSITYTIAGHVENLALTGALAIDGTGNAIGNGITGNSAANTLRGEGGNDSLNGREGADSMIGGAGNDTYWVDNPGDTITELLNEGIDLVVSSVHFLLPNHVDNLVLTGITALNGTGNELANHMTGNSAANMLVGRGGNDVLIGMAGADSLIGGMGNDVYYVENVGDTVTEALNEGIDIVYSTVTHVMGNHVENLVLTGAAPIDGTGNDLNNTLTGNVAANVLRGMGGHDFLIGGGGADSMIGGTGNDTYYVENGADVATEALNEGFDIVYSSVTYTLLGHIENLALTGALAIDGTGNDLGNGITGNAAANVLRGAGGNDALNGLGGIDSLIGGTGDDVYYVESAGDAVTELLDQGIDLVVSSVDRTLSDHVENLVLTGLASAGGTGNALANSLTGNAAANALSGLGGNDRLNGMGGADSMTGGAGDDAYYVDNAGDTTTEALNEGTDTVYSSVTRVLGNHIENLELIGSSVIDGTGNDLANNIFGNGAANLLNGGLGVDVLYAAGGDDVLVYDAADSSVNGGLGFDTLRLSGGGATLDLTLIPDARLRDMEVVDIGGSGNNTLVLRVGDVLAMSSTTDALRVDGNAGDRLTALDAASWVHTGDAGGYRNYTNGAAMLMVHDTITSNLPL